MACLVCDVFLYGVSLSLKYGVWIVLCVPCWHFSPMCLHLADAVSRTCVYFPSSVVHPGTFISCGFSEGVFQPGRTSHLWGISWVTVLLTIFD